MDNDQLVREFMRLLEYRATLSLGNPSPGYQLGWLEGVIKDLVNSSDASKQVFEERFLSLARSIARAEYQGIAQQEQLAVPN